MADVSYLDAAASFNVNSPAYAIGAGVDRGLIVGVQQEGAITPSVVTVAYGGQAMTQIATDFLEAGANDNECTFFLLLEAGIAAAVGTAIVLTGQVTSFTIHARSLENVNQTGGATTIPETGGDQTGAATPNPLTGADINAGIGSAVFALGGCGNATTATWGGTNPLIEETDQQDTVPTCTGSMASQLFPAALLAAVECTWASQNRAGVVSIEIAGTVSLPLITDFGDEEHDDKETGVIISGSIFEAVQGTGKVEASDNATYGSGNVVLQDPTSWAAGSITVSMILGAMAPGLPRYLWVTNDSGDRNAVGFQFHFHRERMFRLELSPFIAGGGEVTTQQMTPPLGKVAGDMDGGQITDDINPATTLTDVTADDYREDEGNYQAIGGAAVPGTTHEFRATIGGVPLDDISVSPEWLIISPPKVKPVNRSQAMNRAATR